MTENNELYDHLSAARVVYQDTFENELDIIRELKIYLIESQVSSDNNQLLYNFYQSINIPITLETITNVSVSQDPQVNNLVRIMFISNDITYYLNNNNNNEENIIQEPSNNSEDIPIIPSPNNNLINILNKRF